MQAISNKARNVPVNIDEEYYQISPEIIASFPKYRPPVDLFSFREDICILAPFSKKGDRLTNAQVEELAQICQAGNLFVSRTDHPIYSKHIVKQLDLILQDKNLKESEIADICVQAIVIRYTDFYEQPVPSLFEALFRDTAVLTEYIWQDSKRINAFVRRLFHQDAPARRAYNAMSVGLWLYLNSGSEISRKELDQVAVAMLVHDIGISKIPPFIIAKKGPLKSEERDKIIQHPILGTKIMQKTDFATSIVAQACFEHHERLDGSGYPQKLAAKNISMIGRIAAIADSFAAMITRRPYAQEKPMADAARELMADRQRYDSEIASLLVGALATGAFGKFKDMDSFLDS